MRSQKVVWTTGDEGGGGGKGTLGQAERGL